MPRIVVVGLGCAGAAALWQLARAGCDVVGIDQFAPPHDQGSSHGQTRLLRVAYAEGAQYVPFVRRAIDLWRELERACGAPLFHQSGVLYAGTGRSPFLASSLATARAHGVRLQQLDAGDEASCGLRMPRDWVAFVELEGGFVEAETAIATLLDQARAAGACVIANRRVSAIEADGGGVDIKAGDQTIRADRVIVTAGAWADTLLPALKPHLAVERRVLHWFADPGGRHAHAAGFKPFIVEAGDGSEFYGFPAIDGRGVKAAVHDMRFGSAIVASADALDRSVSAEEKRHVAELVRCFLPGLNGPTASSVCMYPMSTDTHFIVDRLNDRVIVGAGLSGHGFKFAPALGEALAALALERAPPVDLSFLSLKRFG